MRSLPRRAPAAPAPPPRAVAVGTSRRPRRRAAGCSPASPRSFARRGRSSSAYSGLTAVRSRRPPPSCSASWWLPASTSASPIASPRKSSTSSSSRPPPARKEPMYRWYVVNTYSGHENKVKQNLEHRAQSLNQRRAVRQVVVPTETVTEMKDNQKTSVEKRTMPGYVLVNMELNDDSWQLVKGTPGVTGFVGASNEPVPLTQPEVDRLLHREVATKVATKAQFSIGESVKVISGPLSDFSGEISEINQDASKLKVLVSIFGRETPVEVGFDQVKKI